MKIEVLDNEKIKVTLSAEDLMYHNLKPEKLSAQSPGLHKFLFSVMENVRRETGFNPYRGTVAIEAVQSNQGVVLYISAGNKLEPKQKSVIINGEEKRVKIIARKTLIPENRYMFDNFDDLCNAVKLIDDSMLLKSSLIGYKQNWYFVLNADAACEQAHCILSEHCKTFGSVVASESFLREHGKVIAEKDGLLTFAQGLKKL